MQVLCLLLVMLAVGSLQQEVKVEKVVDHVEVTIPQGVLQGAKEEISSDRHIYTFRGIPFAKPPLGPLRFMDPEPAESWTGVRDATQDPAKCPQVNILSFLNGKFSTEGEEDCLYLSVYTPTVSPTPGSRGLPVIVYIHGGGFVLGSASDMQPYPLLQEDVVVVMIQYRLGALGFLWTEDNVVKGNFGLKDQTEAMRWVQQNIAAFGGDPDTVTIFGLSAGAASVGFHLVNPYAKGLFKRAILQSGAAMCGWATQVEGRFREMAEELARRVNCTSPTPTTDFPLDCLQQTSVEDLLTTPSTMSRWNNMPSFLMPVVDGDWVPGQASQLMKEGQYNRDVEVITGFTRDDGSVFTLGLAADSGNKTLQELNQNFTDLGPLFLGFDNSSDGLYLTRRALFQYLDSLPVNKDNFHAFTELLGDRYFKSCSDDTAELHARHGKVFIYEFQHRAPVAFSDMFNASIGKTMVGHGDDCHYHFTGFASANFTNGQRHVENHMQEMMVRMWYNFAKHGDPTINGTLGFRWSPAAVGNLQYLAIKPSPSMQPQNDERLKFWRTLPTPHNKILFPEHFTDKKSV